MGLEKKSDKKIEKLAENISSLIEANQSIASEKSPNSIVPSYKDDQKIHVELKKLYDFISQTYGYKTMDHMIAIAHSVIIAEVIAKPEVAFLPGGANIIKAIEQAQKNMRPDAKQEPSKMPKGESKRDIAERLAEHFSKPPSKTLPL